MIKRYTVADLSVALASIKDQSLPILLNDINGNLSDEIMIAENKCGPNHDQPVLIIVGVMGNFNDPILETPDIY